MRLRRTLRRVGVSGMARVVPAAVLEPTTVLEPVGEPVGEPVDVAASGSASAPDEGDQTADAGQTSDLDQTADVDHADNAPLLSFEVEGHGEVVTRPRGWTSIRRSAALPVGALVPIAYDPQEPTRVALEGVPQSRSDVFWLLLGLAFAACGVALLATAF